MSVKLPVRAPVRRSIGFLLIPLLLAVTPALEAQQAGPLPWLGADGSPLPFRSNDEVVEFLRTADIVRSVNWDEGITGIKQVTLERDGVQVRAAFHGIDETTRDMRMDSGFYRTYHDSYRGQCAAYAVAVLLGLQSVPPTVCRAVNGHDGSLQLWVEDAVLEEERAERGERPPVALDWLKQMHAMHMFDNLIYNDDRHARNFLHDGRWNLLLIDHTRAFQIRQELPFAQKSTLCERHVWQRIQEVTDDEIRDAVREFLDAQQVNALVKRRTLLVEHFGALIEQRGEAAVLLDSQ